MAIMPSPRVQISHPTWCTGAHDHRTDDTDPVHVSTPDPMVLTSDDFLVSAYLYRSDDIRRGTGRQQVNRPGVELGFVCKLGGGLRLDPLFTPGEARELAATLLRLADLAEAETAEVVW